MTIALLIMLACSLIYALSQHGEIRRMRRQFDSDTSRISAQLGTIGDYQDTVAEQKAKLAGWQHFYDDFRKMVETKPKRTIKTAWQWLHECVNGEKL